MAQVVNLRWTFGDPVSFGGHIDGDFSGVWSAQIRRYQERTSDLLADFVVTATYDNSEDRTDLSWGLSASVSESVPVGRWRWDLEDPNGVTRLAGSVEVAGDVTVAAP